jgi:hypothetical protein
LDYRDGAIQARLEGARGAAAGDRDVASAMDGRRAAGEGWAAEEGWGGGGRREGG